MFITDLLLTSFFFIIKQERTQINEEQRETLKTFFEDGMTRVGSPLISRAASDTGLETSVIEVRFTLIPRLQSTYQINT